MIDNIHVNNHCVVISLMEQCAIDVDRYYVTNSTV